MSFTWTDEKEVSTGVEKPVIKPPPLKLLALTTLTVLSIVVGYELSKR